VLRRSTLTLELGVSHATLHDAAGTAVARSTLAELDAALPGWLGDARRTELDVLLSDAHCRYLAVPRPAGARNASELAAAAQHRFAAMFGAVDDWLVKQHAAPFGSHDLVVGVSKEHANRLQALAAATGVRLRSLRPMWLAWARHFGPSLQRGAHWVVASDGAWVSVGYVVDGSCRSARALRLHGARASLEDLLARERALVEAAVVDAAVWYGGRGLAVPADRLGITCAGDGVLPAPMGARA
jgi:hypothetical protein